MGTIRLTMAQAPVRSPAQRQTAVAGTKMSLFAGGWTNFGHDNVAGSGRH